MLQHQKRYYHHLMNKGELVISGFVHADDVSPRTNLYKRTKPRVFFLLFLSLLSFSLIRASWPLAFSPAFSLLSDEGLASSPPICSSLSNAYEGLAPSPPICSSLSNGSICCDRSGYRTDICFMKGDIRTDSTSSSIFLYTSDPQKTQRIRPYTRKWETSVMSTIGELNLKPISEDTSDHKCDVHHDVPAVFFSTGGYTGNVYHEFNDGIIPLYITSQHFDERVVFVILEYHSWWVTKYADILSQLSDFPPIDFSGDKRTHCFKNSIVGLKIHDELAVDSTLMEGERTIQDFRKLLERAYLPRISGLIEEEKKSEDHQVQVVVPKKPKLVIMSRNGSRSITNEDLLVNMATKIGFRVQVVRPDKFTELARIYRDLNSSDVMLGVHGAALTHFLFMRPGSVFIQVIPLGTEWAAATYYGEPAVKLGLRYIGYKVLPKESSLYGQYDKNDPVLRDPNSVVEKGWEYTKKIYLDNQNVEINLKRFNKRLVRAYSYVTRPEVQSLLAAQ